MAKWRVTLATTGGCLALIVGVEMAGQIVAGMIGVVGGSGVLLGCAVVGRRE